ncbi:MAG: rane protein precursor [Marmoricola sp.]|nr:rane protein precursor [Marmoricola sp.]
MKRPVTLVLVVLLACTGLLSASAWAAADPMTITAYDADYTVSATGDLRVAETLTVNFSMPRHGIFRTFDPFTPGPEAVTVTRDGKPEQFSAEPLADGSANEIRIGDPNVTITGTHVYRIGYRLRSAVDPGHFFWSVIPAEWDAMIDRAHIVVHLPYRASALLCTIGAPGVRPCHATGADTPTVRLTTGPLEPRTGVTITTVAAGPVTPAAGGTASSSTWSARFLVLLRSLGVRF